MKIEEEIKQPKFQSPYQKAIINIIYTSNWLQNKQQEFFKQFGLTATQFNILRILRGQYPNRISATEIKSRMLDRNSDISRLLERLLIKKLIDKTICPNDKRSADVMISKQGLILLESMADKMGEHVLALNEKEAVTLSDLLDKCRTP